MRAKSFGFTLIELVSVIIIMSVLSLVVIARTPINSLAIIEAEKDVFTALRLARLKAMTSPNIQISVVTTSTSIAIEADGVPLGDTELSYPVTLPEPVRVNVNTRLVFDSFGNAPAQLIRLTEGTATRTIRVSGAGYAH